MNVVPPSNVHLLVSDQIQLLAKPIHQTLEPIEKEGDDVSSGSARPVELPVVLRPRLVVVVAEQVGGRARHAGGYEKVELEEARRAAVSIAEGMDPGEIEMRQEGTQQVRSEAQFLPWFEIGTGEPLAQVVEQVGTVFGRRTPVGAYGHRVPPEYTRLDVVASGKAFEHLTVVGGHQLPAQRRDLSGLERTEDLVARLHEVVHFAGEVLLRWGEMELPFEMSQGLLFGQGVPFDRRRSEDAFDEIKLVQLLGSRGTERYARDVLALRSCLTQEQPELASDPPGT
jgi:hypothetical protein